MKRAIPILGTHEDDWLASSIWQKKQIIEYMKKRTIHSVSKVTYIVWQCVISNIINYQR